MSDGKNLFGCFVSATLPLNRTENDEKLAKRFREFVLGESGISKKICVLPFSKYGAEVEFVLLKFYLNPIQIELDNILDVGRYRKREKSFDISIVFNASDNSDEDYLEWDGFAKKMIILRLHQLKQVISKKKLDTQMDAVIRDVGEVLSNGL